MTSVDLDDWMDLWRDEQSDDELEAVRESARQAVKKARLVNYAEHAVSAILILTVLILFALDAAPATAAVTALAIFVILWSSWRRHRLQQVANLTQFDDRRVFLDTGLRAAKARLRRSGIGLALLPPSFVIGLMLRHSLLNRGDLSDFLPQSWASISSGGEVAVGLVLVALVSLWFGSGHLRLLAEVRQLELLREQYHAEALLDEDGVG